MNPIYQSAIDGTLVSPKSDEKITNIKITNSLDIPVYIRIVDTEGNLTPPYPIHSNSGTTLTETYSGTYAVFTTAITGAFICVIQFKADIKNYDVDKTLLVKPNDVGAFPKPSGDILIPSDSARIMVGSGTLANKKIMTREQYWMRSPDSYTLAPNEKRTIGYTTTSGMQTTTSVEQEIASSLGLSASAGWGPISASVSASLSTSSRTMQQVAITTESTRYETVELSNPDNTPRLYLRWQLMEILSIFSVDTEIRPVASIIQAMLPTLIGGPYMLSPQGDQIISSGLSS